MARRGAQRAGKRFEGKTAEHQGAVRATDQGIAGSLWRSDAGAARQKKLQSLLSEDEK